MIVGHQKQWGLLKKIAKADDLSHAYLFSGQEKLGKKKVALEWISLLFDQDLQKGHPDLLLIEPEKKEIQIGQIRDLIWKLSLKPHSAPLKTAIINEAHFMNQEAQTALLKTLEEPRGKTLLILISEFPEGLMPTILSRTQTVKFFPVEKEGIRSFLSKKNLPERELKEIFKVSAGRPGVAIDFVSDSDKLKDYRQRVKELEKISKGSVALKFQYAKDLSKDPKDLKEILNIWLSYFREILLSKLKDQPSNYNLTKLSQILKDIQRTKYLISRTNINSRLALENLMLQLNNNV